MNLNNNVDLKGFVFHMKEMGFEKHSSLFFVLSIPYQRKKGDSYVTEYNTVSCVLNDWKEEVDGETKRIANFKKRIVEGQIIRVQGTIYSWSEGIIDGELVRITPDNQKDASRLIVRNGVRITRYTPEESMSVAKKRMETKQNTDDPREEVQFMKATPEQVVQAMELFGDDSLPQYTEFHI